MFGCTTSMSLPADAVYVAGALTSYAPQKSGKSFVQFETPSTQRTNKTTIEPLQLANGCTSFFPIALLTNSLSDITYSLFTLYLSIWLAIFISCTRWHLIVKRDTHHTLQQTRHTWSMFSKAHKCKQTQNRKKLSHSVFLLRPNQSCAQMRAHTYLIAARARAEDGCFRTKRGRTTLYGVPLLLLLPHFASISLTLENKLYRIII